MDPASDVPDPTSVDPLVWATPFTVPVSSEIHVIYQVHAGKVGNQANSVIVLDNHGEQVGPVEETIEVLPAFVFLPLVSRDARSTTLPMEEDFTTHIPAEWVPFVNYPELDADDWYYVGNHATWGRYDFNAGDAIHRFALSMYLGEGAEEWVDYRIEAGLRGGKEWPEIQELVGIWFRGTHETRTDDQGGDVTGYMFLLKPNDDPAYAKAYLGHIDPNTRKLVFVKDVEVPFPNDRFTWHDVIIEVKGASIRVWVDDALVIGWSDPNATWAQGTVGFLAFQGAASFDYIRVTELE
jgi:hypothetical protein